MGDAKQVKRRVLTHLFGHSSVVAPFVVGASALTVNMATGSGSPWLALAGAVGLLVSVGSLATRWLFKADDMTKRAWDDIEKDRRDARDARLDDLERRLEVDGDPRTEVLLRRLRKAEKDLADRGVAAKMDRASRVEISFQASDLVEQCVQALEASLALRERSRELFGPNRDAMEERRQEEVAEVIACVETLEQLAVDGLGGPSQTSERLQRLRDELHQSLEVARRVEERMKSLESGIGPDAEQGSYADPAR